MPGPLPRWLTGCVCPLLPLSHRPSPKMHWVGSTTIPRSTTSERAELTRLQSVVDLQASEFACHPDRSHRWPPMWVPGRPWRLHPSRTRFVTSPRIGYASRPNRAIDGTGLPPPRSAALLAAPHPYPRAMWIRLAATAQRRAGERGFFADGRREKTPQGALRCKF